MGDEENDDLEHGESVDAPDPVLCVTCVQGPSHGMGVID